jgi:hypothetical protein
MKLRVWKHAIALLPVVLLAAALLRPPTAAQATSGNNTWWATDTDNCSNCIVYLNAFAWNTSESIKAPVLLSTAEVTFCGSDWWQSYDNPYQAGSAWYLTDGLDLTSNSCGTLTWRFSWSRSV